VDGAIRGAFAIDGNSGAKRRPPVLPVVSGGDIVVRCRGVGVTWRTIQTR
jgi:hypothetical protein